MHSSGLLLKWLCPHLIGLRGFTAAAHKIFLVALLFLCSSAISKETTATEANLPAEADATLLPDSAKEGDTTLSTPSPKPKPTRKKQDITDTVRYEADHIDYNAEEKRLMLTGNARIDYQQITLVADTIHYLIDQDLFAASGMPQLVENGDTTVGDSMVYNIKTRRGRVNHASTRITDSYFNGNKIVKSTENELYVDAGDYTTCAKVDTPHYCFYGRNIKIVPNDKIISRPVVLNIGEAPVACLPFFIFPVERKRQSGFLTPVWGGNPTSGGYLDNVGYYFAPNDYVDLALFARVYEFSEFVVNAASSYALKYRLNGSLSTRYALNTGYQNRKKEWAVNYSHSQNITPDGKTKLTGSGNLISQKNFYQRFSEDSAELREQNLKANLALSHEFSLINSRMNLSWNRSHNLYTDMIDENLPSLTFNLPNRPLVPHETAAKEDSLRWFHKIYWGYDAKGIVKHVRSASDSIKEWYRPGASQSINLSAPQKLFNWITVSPSFSGRVSTFYGSIDTAVKRYDTLYDTVSYILTRAAADNLHSDYTLLHYDTLTRNQFAEPESIRVYKHKMRSHAVHDTFFNDFTNVSSWNAGVSMSTNLYGLFPLRIFNFAGMRHTFSPSLSYTFTPEQRLDRDFFDVGIPYDRGHIRSQKVGLSIGNQFDGKILKPSKDGEKPEEKKLSLLTLNLSTGYDFEAHERKWSDLGMNASTGSDKVRITSNANFWFYDESDALSAPLMRNLNVTLSIGTLGAKGTFWGGDLIVLDSLHPDDPVRYGNVGKNGWNVSLTPNFTFTLSRSSPSEIFTPTKQYGLNGSASINITRDWAVQWNGNYNFQSNQWVQNSVNLSCDLECWDMRFQWRPEKLNPGYYFVIRIKKIPEIKWELRE